MSTKQEALAYIQSLGQSGTVTRSELIAAYEVGSGPMPTVDLSVTGHKVGITEVLYFIGGGIVLLGIAILLAQNWTTLTFATKLLATLGAAIAAYIVGLLLIREERTESIGTAFHLIAALLFPVGFFVVLDNAGVDVGGMGVQSVMAAVLLLGYLASAYLLRNGIFSFFAVVYGTWLFFSFTSYLVGSAPLWDGTEFYEYRILASGMAYLALGYHFSSRDESSLSGFLYGFGILGFLGAALALGGWDPSQNVFWELVFPLLAFGTLFASTYLKSRALLVFGTLFLMGYIIKITSEYFSSGLGWPTALVIAGLGMMAVGYLSISIRNKYMVPRT